MLVLRPQYVIDRLLDNKDAIGADVHRLSSSDEQESTDDKLWMAASWARNRRFDGSYCEQLACGVCLSPFAVVIEGPRYYNVWRGSPMRSVIAGEVNCLGRVAVAIGLALEFLGVITS